MPYLTVTEATTNEVHCPGSKLFYFFPKLKDFM